MKKTIVAYTNDAPSVGKQTKVAYYRLTKEMVDFLKIVNDKENIVGFEWDSESPFNFGIIIK